MSFKLRNICLNYTTITFLNVEKINNVEACQLIGSSALTPKGNIKIV